MLNNNVCCVVLAAGEGTRMKLSAPKVLSEVLFEPMVVWVVEAVASCNIKNICVVTGHKREAVEEYLDTLEIKCERALQEERKGTAHAAMMAFPFIEKFKGGDVLIINGDTPFMDNETIKKAYKVHKNSNNSVTVISSRVDDPFGYGRIIRNKTDFNLEGIVEERDASFAQREIQEVNSGAYWFKVDDLLNNLLKVDKQVIQNEYYLTSVIKIFIEEKLRVDAFEATSPHVALGANDLFQLQVLNQIARHKVIDKVMMAGVNIPCRDGVIIGKNARIGADSTILPGTVIKGKSTFGKACKIGPNSQINDCEVGNFCDINQSVCENAAIKEGEKIGPFAVICG